MKLTELTEDKPKNYKCKYCKNDATKGYIWADGRAILPVCADHCDKAKDQIVNKNNDKIEAVKDLTKGK